MDRPRGIRETVLEARWEIPRGEPGIPAYDAYRDPNCPWGMAAAVAAQRKERTLRVRRTLQPVVDPGPPLRGRGLPRRLATKEASRDEAYALELEVARRAVARNEALRSGDAGQARGATVAVARTLAARRRCLGSDAPAFALAGSPYALEMLSDTTPLGFVRNPLLLDEPHPAFAAGRLDAEPDEGLPYYGDASDAETAIVDELRACRAAVAAHDAYEAAQRGRPPTAPGDARLERRRRDHDRAVERLQHTKNELAALRASRDKLARDDSFAAALELERLRRREARLEPARRSLGRVVYMGRSTNMSARRRPGSTDPKTAALAFLRQAGRRVLARDALRLRARRALAMCQLRAKCAVAVGPS